MVKFCSFSVLVLSIVGLHSTHGVSVDAKQFSIKDCQTDYSETCLKLDVASFIDKMSERREFKILPQLSVVREDTINNATESAQMIAEIGRSFPDDKDKRLNNYIFAKLGNFLQSHSLKIQLMNQESVSEARATFTGRQKGGIGGGKGGKKGGMGGLLPAIMMMKDSLMSLAMAAVALMIGKALMTGIIAALLAAVAGLSSLKSGDKHTTYEIIAKPMKSSSHTHSSSHENYHGYSGWNGMESDSSPYSKPY